MFGSELQRLISILHAVYENIAKLLKSELNCTKIIIMHANIVKMRNASVFPSYIVFSFLEIWQLMSSYFAQYTSLLSKYAPLCWSTATRDGQTERRPVVHKGLQHIINLLGLHNYCCETRIKQ